jgi:hypothetical protein
MIRLCATIAAALVLAAALSGEGASQPAGACDRAEGLDFVCGPVASEDLVAVPGTPWLVGSGLNVGAPAHLYLLDTRTKAAVEAFPADPQGPPPPRDPGCPGPPDPRGMSMDGLGLRPGAEGRHILYAANHGDRTAIEMFRVEAREGRPRLSWFGCLPLPPRTLPNAVAPLPGGGLLVSSFYDPSDKAAWARMARGEPTGRLLEWRPGQGFRAVPGGAMSGANGLELSADAGLIFASAWAERKLVVISRADGRRREIPLDFMPDNIRRRIDGTLLVAGQQTRVEPIAACGAQCPQPWVVAEVDPRTGAVRTLLRREGTAAVNYACTALEANGEIYITVRGDDRIAYLRRADLPGRR